MQEKTTGYLLLGLGMLVIFASALLIFLIFTGRMEPVGVFSISAPTINTNDLLPEAAAQVSNGSEIELIQDVKYGRAVLSDEFYAQCWLQNIKSRNTVVKTD